MIVPEARHNSVSRAIRQPTSPIREVTESEGFTRNNDDGQEADFRLANRRLLSQEGMVGKAGFEPAISRSRTERDTRLRYFPMSCFLARSTGHSVPRSRTEWQFAKLGHNYDGFTHSITPA
jgi:hypothetical protein